MNRDAIRETFQTFAGEQRFRRFIHALNTRCKRRLFYWQQQLWDRFVEENPRAEMPFVALQECFRFCELHGCELLKQTASIRPSMAAQYRAAKHLPYSYVVVVRGLKGAPDESIYCPECRRRADEWIQLPRSERSAALKKKIMKQ